MAQSLAALKRGIKIGDTVNVSEHRFPELTGHRVVTAINTVGMTLTLPDGHFNAPGESMVEWPKATGCAFGPEGHVTFSFPRWTRDGTLTLPLITFKIIPA